MTSYIKGLVVGFLCMLLVWYGLFCLQLGSPTPKSTQVHIILSYKYSVAEKEPSPRIIIIGGSNTLNSISAKQVGEVLHIPTYNYGANAGLGIDYILYDAKKHLRPNDIVILSLEYQHYSFDNEITDLTVGYPVAYDVQFFKNYAIYEQLKRIYSMDFFRLLQGLKNVFFPFQEESIGFYIPAMNQYGDITSNKASQVSPAMTQALASSHPYDFKINESAASWGVLKNFSRWAHQRNMRVFISYPPFLYHPDYKNKKAKVFFKKIKNFTSQNRLGVLGDPYGSMYPPEYFFDSVYHLHDVARSVHTRKIIKYLKNKL